MKKTSKRSSHKSKLASSAKSNHSSRRRGNIITQKIGAFFDSRKMSRDEMAKAKAKRLAKMPKSRVKRFFYRLHPKRMYHYWTSKEGLIMGLKLSGIGFAICIIFILGLFAYFRRDLPDPRDLSSRRLNQATKFYDKTGEHLLFEVYGDENRTIVEFDEISDNMKAATVAVEDKDFYEHNGVSFSGILRAAWSNVTSGDSTGQGGSTITQQFIKNSLLTVDQTYTRKVQEVILAIELERLYSKEEILSFYLNEIPYGPQEYGVEAAAQSFFGKSSKDLTIAQSAILAALPQAPTYYSPYGENKADLLERKDVIIDLMADQGYISTEDAEKAKKADVLSTLIPINQRSLYTNVVAPHFVIEVQKQLEELFTASVVQSGGLKVITTLDYELQEVADKAIKENIATVVSPASGGGSGDNAAFVATDTETGQVLAMVGSRDFNYPEYGSFNAAMADRQPGSSFKPFDYSQLFYNDRWGPDSYIYDVPQTWPSYSPKNFDFGYRGRMLVRQALGESRNIPAVKAADIAGIDEVAQLAIDMGNKSLADDEYYDLSYALGAGEVKLAEHANAYATFARGGKYVEQAFILSVENADGEKILEWEQPEGEQVLDEQIAYLMTNVLQDDQARSGTFGLGSQNLVVPGVKHTVKTGTTDQSVDGWMMGYTNQMSFGVWVGNHDNTPMNSITSWQTGPIFTQFIEEAYAKKDYLDGNREIIAEQPEGIQQVKMDSDTGYAASDKSKNTYIGLFPSWYKPETTDEANSYVIDKVSGLKATDCTPERAKETKTGGGLWPEVLPGDYRYDSWAKNAGYDGSGGAPDKDDNVHKCSDKKPNVSLSVSEAGTGTYDFKATVSKGTHNLKTLNFIVNNQIVSSVNISGSSTTKTYTHSFNSTGKFTVKAEVIDTALYDNSSSRSVTVSSTSSGLSFTSHSDGDSNVDPGDTFVWNSVSGASSYTFIYTKEGGSQNTINVNGSTSYKPGLSSNSKYFMKVQAKNGSSVIKESPTITIETN